MGGIMIIDGKRVPFTNEKISPKPVKIIHMKKIF